MNIKQLFAALTLSVIGVNANALLLDFTDANWQTNNPGVTVTASPDLLTFNARDNRGCLAGQATHGLTCDGDGLGVKNDEITQSGSGTYQSINIAFDTAVNVSNIFLLDLFANERSGEIAVIDGSMFHATTGTYNVGGYWITGFSAQGVSDLTFTGNADSFSDYAVAGVEVNPVPLPGSMMLFGFILLGLGLYRRKAIR